MISFFFIVQVFILFFFELVKRYEPWSVNSFEIRKGAQFHIKIKMKSLLKLIILISIWVVMVILELFYRQPLFDKSLDWI